MDVLERSQGSLGTIGVIGDVGLVAELRFKRGSGAFQIIGGVDVYLSGGHGAALIAEPLHRRQRHDDLIIFKGVTGVKYATDFYGLSVGGKGGADSQIIFRS